MKKLLLELKNNKIIKLVFSLVFSIMIIIDKNIVYNGNIFSKIDELYIINFKVFDYILIVLLFIIIYILLSLLIMLLDKCNINVDNKKVNKKFYIIVFILLFLNWLPYVLSYFPFGIYADTEYQIEQAISHHLNNRHPIFNTMIITLFVDIGKCFDSLKIGLQLYSIFQLLLSLSIITYFIGWLKRRNVPNIYLILTILFYMFFPLIPLYVVSFWKDTLFSLFLLLYVLNIYDVVLTDGKFICNFKGIIIHSLLIFLVAFSRNNGIYIVIVTSIFLIKRYFNIKFFKKIILFLLVCIVLIQIPIFNYLNINTAFVENLGVPIQQICYVVSSNGKMNTNDKEFIDKLMPINDIKETYTPALVDSIKFSSGFNEEFLNNNKIEFFKVWFSLLKQNPKKYIEAYLLNTIGFYDIFKSSDVAYTNTTNWYDVEEKLGIKQDDYINKFFGKSIRKYLEPKKHYSSAIFVWLLILSFIICIIKKNNYLQLIPLLVTVATLFLAVPLAFSFRYLYILTLALPLLLISPCLTVKRKKY
ncbi:MAG: hypothetical protein IJ574_05200 [Bacilli bacterium]|nr:hypothetical protein [Bacilli bacterium]